MEDKEDCNCGVETPKPELVCGLEFNDALNFYKQLQKKQAQFETLKQTAKRSKSEKKKKELGVQSIHLQREINQLKEGTQLAFQRFTKCEMKNPQVQTLDMSAAEEQLKATWDSILDSNNNSIPSANGKKKQKSRKKRKKTR